MVEIQYPDLGRSLLLANQIQGSRLQHLAMQREADEQARMADLLPTLTPALTGSDAAARTSALAQLAGLGLSGFRLASPMLAEDRQAARQRVTPMTPEQRQQFGVRGTFAVDGLGRPVQLEAPDTMSPEAVTQRIQIARASREAPVTWQDVRDPNSGEIVGQRSSRGQYQPLPGSATNMFGGGAQGMALQFLTRNAEGYAAGTLTPDQSRQYEAALAFYTQPSTRFDATTGQAVTITPPLPPFIAEAVQRRQGGGAAPAQAPAPTAPAGQAPVGQTGMVADPPAAAPGGVTVQRVAPAKVGEPTGEERLAAGYAQRMLEAERTLSEVTGRGYQPGSVRDAIADRTPVVGNYLMSDQGQQYRQAQEDWVRAKLRRESGAVIGDEEMAREIRTYFPQPGDSAATIAQKARARATANDAMTRAAGRAEVPRPQGGQDAPTRDPLGILGR